MPDSLLTITRLVYPALTAAHVAVLIAWAFHSWLPARRTPWGAYATVMWLMALTQLVLSTTSSPIGRGWHVLCAEADAGWGWFFYRKWRDDDENRPRRRRRVWRLAFGGAR